jgi:hypothetical protein
MITRYLKRLDAAKSKKCNNSFAILILARDQKKDQKRIEGK